MLFWSSCRTIVARSFRASKGSAAEAFFVRLERRITPSAPIRPTRWIQTTATAALSLVLNGETLGLNSRHSLDYAISARLNLRRNSNTESLAALELTVKKGFSELSTGRSTGFAPLRIFPM
jgi:hypothetical protein